MKLLLDTHMLIWMATDRAHLSATEKAALADPDNDLVASSISMWELRVKIRAERRHGKRDLTLDPAGMRTFCARLKIEIDQVTMDDSLIVLRSDPPHKDPFDEMLLVHAQRLGARLLTRDDEMIDHPLAYRP